MKEAIYFRHETREAFCCFSCYALLLVCSSCVSLCVLLIKCSCPVCLCQAQFTSTSTFGKTRPFRIDVLPPEANSVVEGFACFALDPVFESHSPTLVSDVVFQVAQKYNDWRYNSARVHFCFLCMCM